MMKFIWRQLKARFLRWCYLMFFGMWRGECAAEMILEDGACIVCAGTGSFLDNTWKTTRVFYDSRNYA